MRGRWSGATRFRSDPAAAPSLQPSRRQSIALLAVLVLAVGAVTAASYLIKPDRARAFQLLHGSMFLADQVAPVGVDLASGKPTLRLVGADKQVGVTQPADLAVVPLDGGTMLLNRTSGEFNMVDDTGFVIKHDGGGVPLTERLDPSRSVAVASGAQAYIERTGASGTDVFLVDQLTVLAATRVRTGVAPQASTHTDAVGSSAPGTAAAANGNLWLLLDGGGGQRSIREFGVPGNAKRGAELTSTARGSVDGVAAIGTATASATSASTAATVTGTATADAGTTASGSPGGATAVGVASADGIQFIGSDGEQHDVRYAAQPGVDSIEPVSNAQGRLAFLLHSESGWSVVSLGADGSDLRGPSPLASVPAGAKLAAPAISNGSAYTIDRVSGTIYRIGLDGNARAVSGAASYPLAVRGGRLAESGSLADTYVLAHGSRVFLDSPTHVNAVALFTDGSNQPLVVRKSAAVDVSASGGAEALAQGTVNNQRGVIRKPAQAKPKTRGQPINTRIDCRTVQQKPHIPVITQATPGSRTVALAWNYPLLDSQDCAPSTYVVSVKLLSDNAPVPAGTATIQGQTRTNLSGLYPLARYELTVAAYLRGQGTASTPVRVTTGKEGPAAPTTLRVSPDAAGNWNLRWSSCGTVSQGCVPATSWKVIPSFCDGRGLSGAPDPQRLPADSTSTEQPPTVYHGSNDLLGRGLRFQVQGTGAGGESGTPSGNSGCVYSWSPPVGRNITVTASTPPRTTGGGRTSTTASVKFAGGELHDLGGVGGTLTYQLLSGGSVVSSRGPTNSASVRLDGVRAGQRYQLRVLASPPRHPRVVATIGPVDVVAAIADWPTPTVSADFHNTSPVDGTLAVTVDFPPGTETRGETFDLIKEASSLDCGSGRSLQQTNILPGNSLSFTGISRIDYASGSCTVAVQLTQNSSTATSPPLYGAANSARVRSSTFTIDQPSLTSVATDFTAQWAGDAQTGPEIQVSYHGGDSPALLDNWTITATNGAPGGCGTTHAAPVPPVIVQVSPSCNTDGGKFTVSVDYTYVVIRHAHYDISVEGTAPQPVDPSKVEFTAAWDPTDPTVHITYTGSQPKGDLASLDFTETVTSKGSPGIICGQPAHENPASSDPMTVPVDLTACPPTDPDGNAVTYIVDVQFIDPTYNQTGDKTVTVDGVPPP